MHARIAKRTSCNHSPGSATCRTDGCLSALLVRWVGLDWDLMVVRVDDVKHELRDAFPYLPCPFLPTLLTFVTLPPHAMHGTVRTLARVWPTPATAVIQVGWAYCQGSTCTTYACKLGFQVSAPKITNKKQVNEQREYTACSCGRYVRLCARWMKSS